MTDSVSHVAKIKLKVGSMELEYEGDPEFLTGGMEALLETMGGLASKVQDEPLPASDVASIAPNGNGAQSTIGAYTFSTNTIAAHLDAKTAPELVICAMAQLELVQGKSSSSRAEILAEMKNAKTYFTENMRKNMSNTLSSLTKAKRINQNASDSYALSASEKNKVEAKVAEIG